MTAGRRAALIAFTLCGCRMKEPASQVPSRPPEPLSAIDLGSIPDGPSPADIAAQSPDLADGLLGAQGNWSPLLRLRCARRAVVGRFRLQGELRNGVDMNETISRDRRRELRWRLPWSPARANGRANLPDDVWGCVPYALRNATLIAACTQRGNHSAGGAGYVRSLFILQNGGMIAAAEGLHFQGVVGVHLPPRGGMVAWVEDAWTESNGDSDGSRNGSFALAAADFTPDWVFNGLVKVPFPGRVRAESAGPDIDYVGADRRRWKARLVDHKVEPEEVIIRPGISICSEPGAATETVSAFVRVDYDPPFPVVAEIREVSGTQCIASITSPIPGTGLINAKAIAGKLVGTALQNTGPYEFDAPSGLPHRPLVQKESIVCAVSETPL